MLAVSRSIWQKDVEMVKMPCSVDAAIWCVRLATFGGILITTIGLGLYACNPSQDRARDTSDAASSEPVDSAASPESTDGAAPEDVSRWSYALGVDFARTLQQTESAFDSQRLLEGVQDVLEGRALDFSDTEVKLTVQQFQERLRVQDEARRLAQMNGDEKAIYLEQKRLREETIADNRARGAALLAENAEKEGVVVLPSGVQYRVLTQGSGKRPSVNSRVRAHHQSWLISGEAVDDSRQKGRPAEFVVSTAIPGWSEALVQMKVGDEWEIYIPPDLAYGDQERPRIPAGSTMVIRTELLEILEP